MLRQRRAERCGQLLVGRHQRHPAHGPRQGPRLPLRLSGGEERLRHRSRPILAAEPQERLDELRRRGQVRVGDPQLLQQAELVLEALNGGLGVSQPQLQLDERRRNPHVE